MGEHREKTYRYKGREVKASNKPEAAFKLSLWYYKEIAKIQKVAGVKVK